MAAFEPRRTSHMTLITHRGQPHEYQDSETGEKFFSVSQVRDVMCNGFHHTPAEVLEAARRRGSTLHTYFMLMLGARAKACLSPIHLNGLEGYCEAIDRWMQDWKPIPRTIEEPSVNRKLGVAGTRDTDVDLVMHGRTYTAIVDLKTGAPTPTDAVQLRRIAKWRGASTSRASTIST